MVIANMPQCREVLYVVVFVLFDQRSPGPSLTEGKILDTYIHAFLPYHDKAL